jgi:hypothetical protein
MLEGEKERKKDSKSNADMVLYADGWLKQS